MNLVDLVMLKAAQDRLEKELAEWKLESYQLEPFNINAEVDREYNMLIATHNYLN